MLAALRAKALVLQQFYSPVLKRWLLYTGSVALGLAVVGALLGAFVLALLYPTLPSLETLTDYQPKVPLRIVSAEGDLLGEFGEERRAVVRIQEVPDLMRNAILAAEDERFYQHGGVDYLSVLRAAFTNVTSGTQQGAGTITMQVARNFFLTREKTLTRKLREVLLAWKIEANLSKDEILELYVNQIFLGQRAYGFAAASQIYFGKPLKDLTPGRGRDARRPAEGAVRLQPGHQPEAGEAAQQYVLRRMHDLHYLSDGDYEEARNAPLIVRQGVRETIPIRAEHVAEMARQVGVRGVRRRGLHARHHGVDDDPHGRPGSRLRRGSVRGVTEYDRRHGYRGPEAYVNLPDDPAEAESALERAFQEANDSDNLVAAVVTAVGNGEVRGVLSNGDVVRVDAEGVKFAARALSDKAPPTSGSGAAPSSGCRRTTRAAGRSRSCRRPRRRSSRCARRRRDPRAGRRLRLRPQQVQPRDAGVPAAGLGVQAVHLLGGAREGVHAGDGHQRRPVLRAGAQAGGEDWEPKNYDGKFDGPDAAAHRAREVEEPRHRARAPGDRAAVRAGLRREVRLRPEAAPGLPDDGPRRRRGDAGADGRRVLGLRERRLPRLALPDREDHRRARQRAVARPIRRRPARRPSARSTRATRS
jgi:penicillin-binding protein 1A